MKIGFLHTSPVHVATFDLLLAKLDGNWSAAHAVDEGLLADARANGLTDTIKQSVLNDLNRLADQAVDLIVCTCSTLGDVAEGLQDHLSVPVLRVDRPMCAQAIAQGGSILVAATLKSTLSPTENLLLNEARRQGQPAHIEMFLCQTAWPYFEAGDLAAYHADIARSIKARLDQPHAPVDTLIFAQASMAPAADHLSDPLLTLLTSPNSLVTYLQAAA